jgi:uncharacterized repeat protein (TIGR01451 family)
MRRIPFLVLFFIWAALVCSFVGAPILAQEADDDKEPAQIKLDPVADINPVKTQHTLVATVLDKKGNPVGSQRVDWILARGTQCVGDIVEHDDMGAIIGSTKEVVRKLSNNYTISYTNEGPVILTMGNTDPKDDVRMTPGQSWLTITSPVEGETHIIAFCPAIKNANNHKAFAIKYWVDAKITWPEDAVNKVGTPHTFSLKLIKASTSAPLTGYLVNWTLEESGPDAYLGDKAGNKMVQGQTDEQGDAHVVLQQAEPKEGANRVKVELRKPTGELLAIRTVTKEWIAPSLKVEKKGPAEGILGEKVVYTIELTNPGQAEAQDVVLKDRIPEELSYLEANPQPNDVQEKELTWNVGGLAKDEVKKFVVTFKASKTGDKVVNTATATSREAPPKTGTAVTRIGAPEVFIVKEARPEARLNEKITYTLTVKNNGNAVAKGLVVRDTIPSGLKFKERTEGTPLKWGPFDLEPGKSQQFRYEVEAVRTGTFTNIAEAYIKDKPVHKAEHQLKVVAPKLTIAKDGPRLSYLHKSLDNKIVITNDGDGPAKDIEVVDTLPRHLDYIKSSPRGTFRPAVGEKLATITWNLSEIPANGKVEIALELRAKAMGRCRNGVKLISKSVEPPVIPPMEAFLDIEIIGIPAMHISTYDTEDPVEVGKTTVYVVEVRNEGTSNCTVVVMKSRIPEEMELLKAEGPGVSSKQEGEFLVFDAVPVLPPGEKLTFKILCRATKPGSAKHAATLRYNEFIRDITDEEGTSVYK